MTKSPEGRKRVFGVAFPHLGWVPAPRYALRRRLILRHLQQRLPGRVLEIGPGVGALLYELAAAGWQGTGVEASPAAAAKARAALAAYPSMEILDDLPPPREAYDYLLAFEVLEHLEDDWSALASWLVRLRRGGTVLLSVPADPRKWSGFDVRAGHYCRYTRAALAELTNASGCQIEHVYCYGWPLSNVLSWLRARRDNRRVRHEPAGERNAERRRDRTLASGIDRRIDCHWFWLYASPPGVWILSVCC